jgi:hypothetical protein
MLALLHAGQGNPAHLVVFLQQVCGFGGAIANLQMCLPLLSGEQIKCSG